MVNALIASTVAGAAKNTAVSIGRNLPLILGVVAAVLLFFWAKPLLRRLVGLVPDDAPYFVGGGDVLASFEKSGRNKTQRLYTGLKKGDNWLSDTDLCEALKESLNWNDNQLIFIHNAYKNRYGITLYNSLEESGADGCFGNGLYGENINDELKARLSELGLV